MYQSGEVKLNLPRETVELQIRTSEDIPKLPGAIIPGTMALDQEKRRRLEPPNRNGHDTSILELRSPGPGATTNVGESGADRRGFGVGIVSPTRVDLERHRDFRA